MAPKIDHIIIKVPYAELSNPSEWLTRNFTISPGGRHADNKTENRLIIFKDGSYIELIAFIDDDEKLQDGHWWGPQPFGIVDWALTSSTSEDVKAINERIQSASSGLGTGYDDPRAGGRQRPDGVELQWKVTFPHGVKRGEAPFWCHDVTPRELRVLVDDVSTTHPCGALGVGQLTLSAPKAKYDAFAKFYSALFGFSGTSNSFSTSWDIEAVFQNISLPRPSVIVELDDTAEQAFVAEITFFTDTIGLGQSRTSLSEQLGGGDIVFNFVHGKTQ